MQQRISKKVINHTIIFNQINFDEKDEWASRKKGIKFHLNKKVNGVTLTSLQIKIKMKKCRKIC